MPPPKSRGQMLVSLVKPKRKKNLSGTPLTLNTNISGLPNQEEKLTFRSPAALRDTENLREAPQTDAFLPIINISEQDLPDVSGADLLSCSGVFSDITYETPSAISPVIEFIDQAHISEPEPNDIILDLPTATIQNCLPSQNLAEPVRNEGNLAINDSISEINNNKENTTDETDIEKSNLEDPDSLPTRIEFIDQALISEPEPNDIILDLPTDTIQNCLQSQNLAEPARNEDNVAINDSISEIHNNQENTTDETGIEKSNLEDPDSLPTRLSSSSVEIVKNQNETGRPKRGRKRKYADQNRTVRKKKANNNEDYISAKGKKVNCKEFKGTNFNCHCPRKCTEKLSAEQRENEFKKLWSSGSYETRCALLQGSVKEIKKKRSYSITSKRMFTRRYFLCDVEICKKTFLNTLGISQSRIDVALQKFRSQASVKDNRGINSGGRNAISQEQLDQIKRFIDGLPKYVSHYCRDDRTAHYLAPNLNLSIVYDLYKEKHENRVSLSRFKQLFYKDYNLRFKKPQKDTCLRCDRFKASVKSATSEEEELLKKQHQEHLDHAYKLRDQMKSDLARAKTDASLETLTFDLEKTHCLPRLPTSIVYYKRQLNLQNLGIHCGSSSKGYFYIWLEHEAGRGTQEVGSCLKKFISDHLKPTATELILWADSCGGQNRSIKMVLMLLHILYNNVTLQKITLRFLQPGHTYLPNDSEFGDVECASQIRLYTADDYISVMKTCRRKNPFIITRLQKEDFHSVVPMQDRITNRKVDKDKQKISWLATFEIELRKSDLLKLFIKSKLEEDFKVIDISKGPKGRKLRPNFDMNLPTLYPNGRELSTAKVKDLKELMKLIPTDAKPFYNFLKNVISADFTDDTEGFGDTVDFEIDSE